MVVAVERTFVVVTVQQRPGHDEQDQMRLRQVKIGDVPKECPLGRFLRRQDEDPGSRTAHDQRAPVGQTQHQGRLAVTGCDHGTAGKQDIRFATGKSDK